MSSPLLLRWVQGKRFRKVFRWGSDVKIYKPISGMPQLTPVRFTVAGHGMPDGWPFKVTNLGGPQQLNDRNYKSKFVDANTIEVNAINAGGLPAYQASTGYIEYFTPVDLSVFTAGRIVLKENATDSTPVLDCTIANGRLLLDNTAKTLTLDIPAADTVSLAKYAGVWDWEMTAGAVISSPLEPIAGALPPWQIVREAAS